MDAIKKKMQAMKLEKENAMEKSDEMEQKLQEQKDANEKVGGMTSPPTPPQNLKTTYQGLKLRPFL